MKWIEHQKSFLNYLIMEKRGVIVYDKLFIFFIRINCWWINGNSYDVFMNYDNKQSINRTLLQMMDKGNALITKRILECYKVYNGNRESILPFND